MLDKKTTNIRFDADVYDAMQLVMANNKIRRKGPVDMATLVSLACRIHLKTIELMERANIDIDKAETLSATAIRRYIEDLQIRQP